jgi:hypothetical protein
MLWGISLGGVGFLGYAVYYFVTETNRVRQARMRPRKPWDLD